MVPCVFSERCVLQSCERGGSGAHRKSSNFMSPQNEKEAFLRNS